MLVLPKMRNCSDVPSIHHATSTNGFARICATLGVLMSVELSRIGIEGFDSGEMKDRNMCERTCGRVGEFETVEIWITVLLLRNCYPNIQMMSIPLDFSFLDRADSMASFHRGAAIVDSTGKHECCSRDEFKSFSQMYLMAGKSMDVTTTENPWKASWSRARRMVRGIRGGH